LARTHGGRATLAGLLFAASIAVLGWTAAAGDAGFELVLAEAQGDGWRATGITISMARNGTGGLSARLRAARLELPEPVGVVESFDGACADLSITTLRFTCRRLALATAAGRATSLDLQGHAEYRRDTGALRWDLFTPRAAAGRLSFSGTLTEEWTVQLTASAWPAADLAELAGMFISDLPALGGDLDVSMTARGTREALRGLVFEIRGVDVGVSNDAGTVATEGLVFTLSGSAWREEGGLGFDARGSVTAGEAYVEPVYVNLADHGLRLVARGTAGPAAINISQLVLEQQGVGHADLRAELGADGNGWTLRTGRLRIAEATLPGAYAVLLQPFLAGTPFDDLETAGTLHGELLFGDARLQSLRLDLFGVQLDDRAERLAVYDLSGGVAWADARLRINAPAPEAVNLGWSGGFVYGIPFGATRLQMDERDGRWSLRSPVTIPVLDGALEVATLEIGDFLRGDDTLLFDAQLSPVSMRELSRALDWPPLSGQLSGTLPTLSYADGVLAIAGELQAEIFDGLVAVRNLRIERPLQPRARLLAEVEIRGLELAELTTATAFGLMTGRLDGHIRGLEMIDWAPVAFDARIYTPEGDRSRRRISQRAVDNIASIGGGGAGLLSTGFLRFFEDFAYDAFALGCRLERDVCEMSGLDTREKGYVILRGRGLPRIDVMGFAQRVSWSTLVEQLASITESEGPVVR
jgi:hypothetical protein